jgi:GNAT superfamily N-acetyltransferase
MSNADVDFAVHITGQMGWELARSDFEFMMELEPKGCFVLSEDSEKIGIATAVSFGKIAWFGNLIVNESKRGRGAGSLLVNHSFKYLKSKKVETVGLYAYMERISFYKRLGFKPDLEFMVLKGTAFPSPSSRDVTQAGKKDIEEIVEFDRAFLGESRKKMLEPILSDPDNLCYISTENEKIVGYSVAKVFRGMAELGPLLCEKGRDSTAMALLKTTLNGLKGLEVSLFVPEKEDQILSMLAKNGFRESFKVERMFHGPPVGLDWVYMAESLERG